LRQVDITSRHRFGRLIASHRMNHGKGKNGSRWVFQCVCGFGKIIASSYVRNGLRTSYGHRGPATIAHTTEQID
jgi:hypothetical protein